MTASRAAIVTLVAASVGTASCQRGFDRVRFKNAPIAWAVNDRANVPRRPGESYISNRLYHYDALVHDRIVGATLLRRPRRARDINALGEVPDSSWFTNRIGAREVSTDEVRRGPNRDAGPMAAKPWKVTRAKTVGVAPGFIMKDSAGETYILKFDDPAAPEAESAAHIVVHRLLWTLGYNVPEDHLVTFRKSDLTIADDAVVSDPFGRKRPMSADHLARVLARAHQNPDGSYRALVTRFVPGKPLGGFSDSGVREDDPNDTIDHEHRRVLRGLQPIAAWLKHTDIKPDNTLDAWVTDEQDPERRYVRHYLIDFGKALGVLARQTRLRSDGYARWLDFADIARSIVTIGIYPREWDGIDSPRYRGLGIFQVERYDPGSFESRTAWQPFVEADKRDMLWGAALIMRLRPEHIRAAVDEARLSDPRASAYLADTLIARQRKTARYWFARANPLDRFSVSGRRGDVALCFDDLVRRYQLAGDKVLEATRYTVEVRDHGGRPIAFAGGMTRDTRTQRLCVSPVPTSARPDGYTIIAIDTLRPGLELEPVLVHIAFAPGSDQPRVVGVRRL